MRPAASFFPIASREPWISVNRVFRYTLSSELMMPTAKKEPNSFPKESGYSPDRAD